ELVTETVEESRKAKAKGAAKKAAAPAKAAPAKAAKKDSRKGAEAVVEAEAADAPIGDVDLTAPAALVDAPAAEFGEGSYLGDEPPAGYDIKGNRDSMKFHTTESRWYEATKAEVWFNSVEAAEAAGFVNVLGEDDKA
ncbi:MAG TPA: hypothetical protein PLE12_11035, partial [Propionicimonas sp.]|nr:hypothetical protein [Propionicimonas sp.]